MDLDRVEPFLPRPARVATGMVDLEDGGDSSRAERLRQPREARHEAVVGSEQGARVREPPWLHRCILDDDEAQAESAISA